MLAKIKNTQVVLSRVRIISLVHYLHAQHSSEDAEIMFSAHRLLVQEHIRHGAAVCPNAMR